MHQDNVVYYIKRGIKTEIKDAEIDASIFPKESYKLRNAAKSGRIVNCVLTGDFSKFDFEGIFLKYVTFKDAILPEDKDFFEKISREYSVSIAFPDTDLGLYDFTNVVIRGWTFTKATKMPKNRSFFSDLYSTTEIVKWPWMNMNDYDFCGVSIDGFHFTEDTIMSSDICFFQKIHGRSACSVTFPEHDYSNYLFDSVNIEYSTFTEHSILPKNWSFLRDLHKSSIRHCVFSECDLSAYDWQGVSIEAAQFTTNSKIPEDELWFEKVGNISDVSLPSADYSRHSFKRVPINRVKFTRDSIIPLNILEESSHYGFFSKIHWPDDFLIRRVLLDIGNHRIDLTESNVSEDILKLLWAKYRHSKNITLPELKLES